MSSARRIAPPAPSLNGSPSPGVRSSFIDSSAARELDCEARPTTGFTANPLAAAPERTKNISVVCAFDPRDERRNDRESLRSHLGCLLGLGVSSVEFSPDLQIPLSHHVESQWVAQKAPRSPPTPHDALSPDKETQSENRFGSTSKAALSGDDEVICEQCEVTIDAPLDDELRDASIKGGIG